MKLLPFKFVFFVSVIVFHIQFTQAQTDITISGAQAGFPVAVAQLCDQSGGSQLPIRIPETISRDLQISGLFKVLNPASFIETPGKCTSSPQDFAYSDWSVVGAEGLVKGIVTRSGDRVTAELYLHDVLQQKAVIARRYTGGENDFAMMAHRFANEILLYFTGEKGVFGTRIAHVGSVGRFKELFVMDLDGSNSKQLTNDRGLVFSPAWSPSGDQLVYTSYASKTPDLYTISPDGRGKSVRITKRPGLEVGAKYTSSGSTLISSASFDGISKLVLLDMRGTILKKLTSSSSIDVSPSYSPDYSKIAFCSNRAGGPQIYTMSADGGDIRRISYTDSKYCTSPAWSPKGDKIVFVCAKGGFQLFMSDPEGGNTVQLTFSGDNEDPSWSPDGRFIAFSSTNLGGRSKQIGILSLLGGRPTRVTESGGSSGQPAWSPMID
ncbi:MAG TPA: Tol-Pal system beta propeller repeat protein TolB [Oligoflexia bacterium]|nr:Tol-Pal system beta propeller repeat protein TolB [Oligoflexia bacterium]HMP47729.1 Tol-Pal system beta propeller repeat protein TolB [Oligoflexia bacterium]